MIEQEFGQPDLKNKTEKHNKEEQIQWTTMLPQKSMNRLNKLKMNMKQMTKMVNKIRMKMIWKQIQR